MKRILIFLINAYRQGISPLYAPCCRFTPTCSSYALEAVNRHGAFKGSLLALWRIVRCNPFGKCGYDPVPEVFEPGKAVKRAFKRFFARFVGEKKHNMKARVSLQDAR